jgi:tRNA A58 N-methylase Trm61
VILQTRTLPTVVSSIKLPLSALIIRTFTDNGFENLEVKEIILRDWVVDDKKLRPSNKMISHTGFLVSGQKIIF